MCACVHTFVQELKSDMHASSAALQGPEGMGRLRELRSELAHACNTLVAGIAGLYALGGASTCVVCACAGLVIAGGD